MTKNRIDLIKDANIEKSVSDKPKASEKPKTSRILQTNVPSCSVSEALSIARALWENYAGKPTTPINVCKALNISPASSKWRDLAGASIAYGLTNGGCNAKMITLEPLGKRAVAPTDEGDDLKAIREAVIRPTVLKTFFEFYQDKRMPKDNIAENMLVEWGVPKNRAPGVFQLIKDNGAVACLLTETKGGLYIQDHQAFNILDDEDNSSILQGQDTLTKNLSERLPSYDETISQQGDKKIVKDAEVNNRVFISHGHNKTIVENLKTILSFGKFIPIVSVERESTAISVPEKVFSDMRSCCAGIIHVEEELTLLDNAGNKHTIINENVLIEIDPAPKRCTKLKVSQSGIMSAKEWDQCQGKHSRWSRSSSSYGRSRYCAGRARQSPRL